MAAIDDTLAAVSYGAYPEPTPTNAQRAIFAASYGLLSTAPLYVAPVLQYVRAWKQIKLDPWDTEGPWDE